MSGLAELLATQGRMYAQNPAGAVTGYAARDDARRGELGWLKRPDGMVSTELSATDQMPNGQWLNFPTLVQGQQGVPNLLQGQRPTDEQTRYALMRALARMQAGAYLPTYSTLADALRVAETRPPAQKLPYFRGQP